MCSDDDKYLVTYGSLKVNTLSNFIYINISSDVYI